MKLRKYLRRDLAYAEWHDKVIHYCDGDSVQNWSLSLLLPVPIDSKNKSAKRALKRFFKQVRGQ